MSDSTSPEPSAPTTAGRRARIGDRLGPYVVRSHLGAGGMGEVYEADDSRLGRHVAIKVLPTDRSFDSTACARFQREAKAIAALNHRHICTAYDVGHADGVEFIVMERLDGQTLAARLRRGALSYDRGLAIAIEIAEALDAAHRLSTEPTCQGATDRASCCCNTRAARFRSLRCATGSRCVDSRFRPSLPLETRRPRHAS